MNPPEHLQSLDYLLLLVAAGLAAWLLRPGLRERPFWRATVTPLASIIGSGFLIIAPLLGAIAGTWALAAMSLVIALAYAIGSIIRFNIRHAEPALQRADNATLVWTERLSNMALSAAYVVSIAFYLRLMASFVLENTGFNSDVAARSLTTVILLFIGLSGWRKGLNSLERLEEYSVSIKLAIIAALLLGLFHYDLSSGFSASGIEAEAMSHLDRIRMLAGMLLVVQGFETSRYLGHHYPAELRIRSMRLAQWLAGAIYLLFVFLVMPLLPLLNGAKPHETAIIELAGQAAIVLPFLLVIAAAMSQFSAAVADTVGAGGLVDEESRQRIPSARAYLLISGLAVVLVWSANVFEIISLASRAFAAYYFAQALVALQVVPSACPRPLLCRVSLSFAASLLLLIVVFAIPVD